eukprot:469144-Rhodomonas_salina.2
MLPCLWRELSGAYGGTPGCGSGMEHRYWLLRVLQSPTCYAYGATYAGTKGLCRNNETGGFSAEKFEETVKRLPQVGTGLPDSSPKLKQFSRNTPDLADIRACLVHSVFAYATSYRALSLGRVVAAADDRGEAVARRQTFPRVPSRP